MEKEKILFVGSFKETSKDGSVGGQMFACKTIINSEISEFVEWTLIDSTANSNILSHWFIRIKKACIRLIKFVYFIVFFRFDCILIFTGDGWSLWEKGVMGLLGKFFTKGKIIIAPRSGFIIKDIQDNKRLKAFIRIVFRMADIVVCQSNYWKTIFENLTQKSDDSKFIIIENLIDFEKYKNLPFRNVKKGEKVVILFMSWVTRNKGIFELLEAAKLLKNDNLNFEIIIAGRGDSYDDVVNEVVKFDLSKFIIFKGWLLGEKKMAALSESDIFVLPTYFDGYPNSLMEAMASGKSCIATKVGSIPDMIDNEKNGLLIEKENSIELFECLKMLIENEWLREKLALAAREKVRTTNSIPLGIVKYSNLFVAKECN